MATLISVVMAPLANSYDPNSLGSYGRDIQNANATSGLTSYYAVDEDPDYCYDDYYYGWW